MGCSLRVTFVAVSCAWSRALEGSRQSRAVPWQCGHSSLGILRMALGKRKRERQPAMWMTTTDLPTAASHPFYRRLNHLLREHGFDEFAEAQCAALVHQSCDLGVERPARSGWEWRRRAD
jgi:hypothetical protein